MRRKRRIALLGTAALSLFCTACTIFSYSFPADQITLDRPITPNSVISFNLHGYSRDRSVELGLEGRIRKGLVGTSLFQEAVLVPEIPDAGPFVSVDLDNQSIRIGPSWNTAYMVLTALTLYLIPYYGDRPSREEYGEPYWFSISRPVVVYRLFVDGKEQSTYRYAVKAKIFSWILVPLALPFLSETMRNYYYDYILDILKEERFADVLTATTRRFLSDAQREGQL